MAFPSGNVIIITGASEGIGRALALALSPSTPKLALAARNAERLKEVAHECQKAGAQTLVVPTDVTHTEDCRRLIEETVAQFGRVDVLINNAGGTMWTTLEEVQDLSIFEKLMQVNYLGSVYCTKFALPYLKHTKGQIVALSSIAGLTGVPTRTGYAASKFAMIGFFESLRIELDGTGVGVTIIAPDFVQSKIHERALGKNGQPVGFNRLEGKNILSAEFCAALIVKAMETRQRLVITSWRGRVGRWAKLFAPRLIDRITKQAMQEIPNKNSLFVF